MAKEELAPFVLEKLDSGEKKGSGAYGAVYEVTVKGVTCIAKRLHDILVTQVSPREKSSIQQKFTAECVLLSKLRHPNVVHFVGVHYGRSANDLSLVMECLHTDLAKFLEGCSSEIPLSIKLSILLDVSYGLLYFHNHTPLIIHRDLSANNVLLTTDLRAKIADLGVAKLLDRQAQAAIVQTMAPGSQDYMPPEALKESPIYNFKLDIFSVGHLMLYVAAQEYPVVHELDDMTMYAALQQSTVQIQRRRRAIEQIGGKRHTLYLLITHCLQDKLERRPTTIELNDSLKELCTKHPRNVAKLSLEGDKELAQYQRDVTQLTTEVEQLRKEKADLLGEVEAHKLTAQTFQEDFQQERKDRKKAHSQVAEIEQRYQHQLQSMVEQLDRTTQELERTKKDLARHKDTLSTTETLLHSQIDQLSERLCVRDDEVATFANENQELRQEVLSKTQQVKQYKKQVDQYKEQVGAFKHQAELQIQQVEKFAQEADDWKTKCKKVEAEARKERGMKEAFERRAADLEKLNDQLQEERKPLPAKPEPSSRKPPKPQPVQKGYSVDDKRMLNSRGSGTYSQQTPVPRAATDIRAQPHPPSPLVQPGKPVLAQSFQVTPADHRGDDFDRPPIPPRTVQPGFGGVSSTGSVASHTHSAGFSGGSGGDFSLTRPYVQGGWEHPSNMAMTGHPPHSQHNIPPVTVGGYHDPHNPIPRASTRPDAPLGYHYQPQPAQFQKRNAYSSLHPGYPNASPSLLPPMSTVSGEVNSYQKHAHDDSGLYHEHTPDFAENDSPPSSNISSQSSQHPESNQQLPHHFGSHRQPAGAASGRQGALPSRFHPSYRPPMSHAQVSHQPISSQGLESDRLEVGIEREIYRAAKDVIKSDSEAPQTLGDEDIPYDPNLICPKCNLNFRIGEIQKYRRHLPTCKVGGK